jgi:hypothetical protein
VVQPPVRAVGGSGVTTSVAARCCKKNPSLFFSYVEETDLMTNVLLELYRTLSRLGRQANQGEIGVVIDGKYY